MYNKVIIKAMDYIIENIEEPLTVEVVANHCHFSKYYFNRMFKEAVGESVYAFIKRLKIEKSAFMIVRHPKKSITEISANYGYTSSNYSSAFKKHYNQSPNILKKNYIGSKVIGDQKGFYANLSNVTYDYYNKTCRYETLHDIHVVYQRFIGHYHNLDKYWNIFCERHQNLMDKDSRLLEISYDDPILTDPDRCIMDTCLTIKEEVPLSYNRMTIKGGNYIIYNFKGSNKKIFQTIQGLFTIWFPNSPYDLDFELRKMFTIYKYVDCKNNYFDLDICIPVK